MAVISLPIAPSFSGLDDAGWLMYPNRFICLKCGFGVSFSQQSLINAASYVWQKTPRQTKLKEKFYTFFESYVENIVGTSGYRFALDFHCPKCSSPYTLAFEYCEFHMASVRFKPIAVWGIREKTVNA